MADNDNLEIEGEAGQKKGQSPLVKVAAIVLILLFLYWRMSGPSPEDQAAQEQAEAKQASEQEAAEAEGQIDLESSPDNSVAITRLTKDMEQLQEDQKKTQQIVEEYMDQAESQFRQFRGEMRGDQQRIIEEVADLVDERVRAERDRGLGLAEGGYPALPGEGADGDAMVDDRDADPFQYRRSSYANRRGGPQAGSSGGSGGGDGSQAVVNGPPTPPGWENDGAANSNSGGQSGPSGGGSGRGGNAQASNQTSGPDGYETRPVAFVKEDTREAVTVPAFSFARAQLLHGVACPVSNSIGEEFFGKAPIVIPITGTFSGPNGDTKSIGRAHLFGFCVGVPSEERPYGRIKVEQLSYVDAEGEAQTISVNGYVLDTEDNAEGVRGTLESRKMGEIAWAAGAQAIHAIGNIAVQSQYQQQTSSETGNVLSTLSPGNLATAGGAAAFASAASEIAKFFRGRADEQIDVVHVMGGTELQFIVTEKFQVMTLKKANEAEGGARRGQPIL